MTPDSLMSPDDPEVQDMVCKWLGCEVSFDSLEELVSHLTASHVTSQHGAFYCLWRGCPRTKGFNARYKMLIHIRTHTNERPYVCSECDKRFSRQENLRIHARTHTGEKPYICTVPGCGKAYSNSSDRFKHTRTHFVDKPYECRHPGCGKRYTDPSSLRKHVKIYGHTRRSEETTVVASNNELLDSTIQSVRLDLSPSPSSSGSSLGPSPVPSVPSPALLSPSFFQTNVVNNVAAAASATLGVAGLSSWAPVTAAAAWTVALQQYQAGLLFSSNNASLAEKMGSKDDVVDDENEENTPALDLTICSSPLDLSLPSSRNKHH